MGKVHIDVPKDKIAEFCGKWKIREFALFGSVLRDDFRPDSDVDVLVTFAEDADHSLFDFVHMKSEWRRGQVLLCHFFFFQHHHLAPFATDIPAKPPPDTASFVEIPARLAGE